MARIVWIVADNGELLERKRRALQQEGALNMTRDERRKLEGPELKLWNELVTMITEWEDSPETAGELARKIMARMELIARPNESPSR